MKKAFFLISILVLSTIFYSLNISVSINPYYLVLKELKAPKDNLHLIVESGKSPHTYALKPNDLIRIYESDLIIANGLGVESFIEKLIDNLNSYEKDILFLSDYINEKDLILFNTLEHDEHEEDEEDEEHDEHEHGKYDPHFWQSPYIITEYIIPVMTNKLIELNPKEKNTYIDNKNKLINKINIFDKKALLNSRDITGSLLTFHGSFNYFFNRYNIKNSGVIQLNPGIDPKPLEIVEISKKVKEENVKIIYTEPQLSDRAAKKIANSLNLKIGILDPLGNDELNSIVELYEYNLTQLINGLD